MGQQKEMSVIEHHRKQSLQKAQQQSSTSYSISAHHDQHCGSIGAHTGRTSAYGGRDYEYSANLTSGSSRRQSSGQQSHIQQSIGQHSYSSHQQSLGQQHQSYSSQKQSISQQQTLGQTGGFNARQVAGYSASRQTGAAFIQGATSANSASSYQSTSQGSYKGTQQETRRSSSGGRRKTWAESSILHSPGGGLGQSMYAQDFQQHTCPASKVYTDTSPFKYERQSSSGHKLFRQQDSGLGRGGR